MLKSRTKRLAALVLLSTFAASVSAHPPGRFTGGGFLMCTPEGGGEPFRVTFGYTLHCKTDDGPVSQPNNFQINFLGGNHFHLTELTAALCSEPPTTTPTASVSVLDGAGTGLYNGSPGTIDFLLTDVSEPGRSDTLSVTISGSGGPTLECAGTLRGGNNQAHDATGNKL